MATIETNTIDATLVSTKFPVQLIVVFLAPYVPDCLINRGLSAPEDEVVIGS